MSLRFLKDLHGRRSKKAELQNEIRTCLNLSIATYLLCVKHSLYEVLEILCMGTLGSHRGLFICGLGRIWDPRRP